MPRFLWTQKQDFGATPRAGTGMTYDPVRRLTHLFGGYYDHENAKVYCADTWAWGGRFWTQVARFGPSARTGHTMTFDIARGNAIVFGGSPAIADTLGDTWAFDGVEWTQVDDFGPLSRQEHAAAYDPVRQRVVLFGGVRRDEGILKRLNDTWEWDGESWTQVDADGPTPRNGHMMAYDTYRNRIVLFGGIAAAAGGPAQYVDDTWEWNGDTWTQVAEVGPTPRRDAAMASNDGGLVILHGGVGADAMADTWQWAAGNWSKVQEMGPPARNNHVLSYDSDRRRFVLFGGLSLAPAPHGTLLGDTWEAPGFQ